MLHAIKKNNKDNHIIFIHGNSQSLQTWDTVMQSDKLKDYALVAVDLPGHGNSDHSESPEKEYTLKGLSNLLLNFVGAYQDKSFIFVTNSLGGNLVAEMEPFPDNCKGLILTGPLVIGGNILVSDIIQPNPNVAAAFAEYPSDEELEGLMADMAIGISDKLRNQCSAVFRNTDPAFRQQLSLSFARAEWSNEIEKLNQLQLPLAIVYGEQDKIVNPDYLAKTSLSKWKGRIIKIADAGHCLQLDQPEKLASLIAEFAEEVFK